MYCSFGSFLFNCPHPVVPSPHSQGLFSPGKELCPGKNLFKLLVSIARAFLGAAVLGMLGWVCFDKESSSYGDAALWYQHCRLLLLLHWGSEHPKEKPHA